MSNVLIGIIGIILFIGLALAGALILGDDFRDSSNATKAATISSQMKQMLDAYEMRRLKLGVSFTPSSDPSFLIPRFLRIVPVSPTTYASENPSAYLYQYRFNNNVWPDGSSEPAENARFIQVVIGPSTDEKTRGICQALAEMSPGGIIQSGTDHPPVNMGCADINGYYIAFQRT